MKDRDRDKMTISKDDVGEINPDDLTEAGGEGAEGSGPSGSGPEKTPDAHGGVIGSPPEEAAKGEQPDEPTDAGPETTEDDDKEVAADSPEQQDTEVAEAAPTDDHARMVPGTDPPEPIFPIDRKYKGTVAKVDDMQVVGDWMVFRAQDKAVVPTLHHYISICEHLHCAPEHIESVRRLIGRVVAYQQAYPEVVKVPD